MKNDKYHNLIFVNKVASAVVFGIICTMFVYAVIVTKEYFLLFGFVCFFLSGYFWREYYGT